MIISARNTLANENEKTYLTNPEVAGTNILRWKNPNPFQASWAVQVGKTGAAQSEIALLSASTPAGTAGTLTGNTLYEHPSDTPIYAIKYDQVVFEVSLVGTVGTAAPITNGSITIQSNSSYTIFDHTAGSTSYAYKTYFRNSVTGSTSAESDWITSAGFSFYSLGKIRQRVKNKLWDASYITDDLTIDDWINEYYQIANNEMVTVNEDYGLGTVDVGFANNVELGTITNTDFRGQVVRVWNVSSTGTFQSTKMEVNSYIPTKTFTQSYPYHYFQGDNIIGRKPIDTAGTLSIIYKINQPILVNDADELPQPMRGYTQAFVDYAYAQALRKDNKNEIADPVESKAYAMLEKMKQEIVPHSQTGITYIQVVEDTGADQDIWL